MTESGSMDIVALVAVAVIWLWLALFFLALFAVRLLGELRLWRSLMQQYLQKLVNAPLPLDEKPDAPAESTLHLPDGMREELDREDEEL